MLATTNATILFGLLKALTLENVLSMKLVEIAETLKVERYFHTMVYMGYEGWSTYRSKGPYNEDTVLKSMTARLNIPIISMKGNVSHFLWPHYNRELLAMAYLKGIQEEDKLLLETLWKSLRRNIRSRLIIVAKDEMSDNYLADIVKFCVERKAINVMVVKESVSDSQQFFVPQIFPRFSLNSRTILNISEFVFYPNQIKNMHGSTLRIVMNKKSNKAYLLRQSNGKVVLAGYVGHLLSAFAKKYNATIKTPAFRANDTNVIVRQIDKLVEQGLYDMSAELTMDFEGNASMEYSTICDYLTWCLMVPVGKQIPTYKLYGLIFDIPTASLVLLALVLTTAVLILSTWRKGSPILLKDTLIIIYILNGLLGQSFKMEQNLFGLKSFLYVMISLVGIIFNTSFVTYLQTYKTTPPSESPITNLEMLEKSGMQFIIQSDEFVLLDSYGNLTEYKAFAKVISSFDELNQLRDNYDSRYLYTVTSSQWPLHEQQQKFFTKPLFRLSDMCFVKLTGISVGLQNNSIYKEPYIKSTRKFKQPIF
uniref:Ionotropic glutamate receptor C-terminal domain-containing protein n=1 Tax=Stomoxys calcitrans TaxID=35570 RepID=A0A905STF6_STOCA